MTTATSRHRGQRHQRRHQHPLGQQGAAQKAHDTTVPSSMKREEGATEPRALQRCPAAGRPPVPRSTPPPARRKAPRPPPIRTTSCGPWPYINSQPGHVRSMAVSSASSIADRRDRSTSNSSIGGSQCPALRRGDHQHKVQVVEVRERAHVGRDRCDVHLGRSTRSTTPMGRSFGYTPPSPGADDHVTHTHDRRCASAAPA
jgi:hypothetical protein